jgi:hypothetical protein
VHRLHAQHLIVALLVVEHGSRKVLEHIFSGQWSIRLRLMHWRLSCMFRQERHLDPLMPYKKPVTIVIRRM